MKSTQTIEGLANIINQYDVFILDQWGVMHDGIKGYVQAIKCVEKLYQEKKEIIIISNSSKRKESTIKKLSKLRNFNYCILRLFQIYGKNISTNIIYRFIKMKKNNLKITINGDGKQIRDQLHVKDLVRAIYKISIKLKKQNYILNVCSGKGIQIINIVKKIGAKFKLSHKDNGEPKLVIGSNRKLAKLINWKPRISINEGIKSLF